MSFLANVIYTECHKQAYYAEPPLYSVSNKPIMLSIIMLSVIMLGVVVPRQTYLTMTNTLAYYSLVSITMIAYFVNRLD